MPLQSQYPEGARNAPALLYHKMKTLRFFLCFMLLMTPVINSFAGSYQMMQNDSLQTEEEDVITQPEFDGGMEKLYEYIMTNFEYPEECKKRNARGTVEIRFTVGKSGDVMQVYIVEGIDPDIDEELLRVFRAMPLWVPATKNGEPVRYTVTMSISLKLSRNNKNEFK